MLDFNEPIETERTYDLIETGDYEVTITAEWKKTRNDDDYINIACRLRKDVDQKYGGRIVFDAIYKSKSGEFNKYKIQSILSAIPSAKKEFEDYDELIQYINGNNVKVTIETQPADPAYPTSKDKNVIKFMSYKPSADKDGAVLAKNGVAYTSFDDDAEIPF